MVSLFVIWQLTNFLLVLPCQAIIWCAFGYSGSNIYLYGKNTYFQNWDSLTSQEYYKSDAVPVEADRSVFIWKNTTNTCYHFLTLPSITNQGKQIPIPGMTIHATCTDCTVSNPESCPLWYINNEGNNTNFKLINTNQKCQADNWIINNTLHTPQNQPADICMHHTDQYNPIFNDQNWQLFSTDPHKNPYYYLEYRGQYITQYYHNITSQYYWIQYEIKPLSHQQSIAYCKISNYTSTYVQSIIDCTPWYYQKSSQYLLYNITLNAHDCAFISDDICVYDSSLPYHIFNKDINGDYNIYSDPADYDGFRKINGDLAYIRFVENTWKIGYNYDLNEFIFSTCNHTLALTQINPFDITSCNGYWQLPNQHHCCDTLTISNTPCNNRSTLPTRSPTNIPSQTPTSAMPSETPTIPTQIPTFLPTNNPSITPSNNPSSNPIATITSYPTTNIPSTIATDSTKPPIDKEIDTITTIGENGNESNVTDTNGSNITVIIIIIVTTVIILVVCILFFYFKRWRKPTVKDKIEININNVEINKIIHDKPTVDDDDIVAQVNQTDMGNNKRSDDDLIAVVNETDIGIVSKINSISNEDDNNEEGDLIQTINIINTADNEQMIEPGQNTMGMKVNAIGESEGVDYILDEDGAKEVRLWLDSIGFGMYYDILVNNGFDSMESIQEIRDENDLSGIGVKLKGHQLKLLKYIKMSKTYHP